MVSLKVLVLTALVAVAATSPAPEPTLGLFGDVLSVPQGSGGNPLAGLLGGKSGGQKGKGGNGQLSLNQAPLAPLFFLAKGVTDIAGNAGNIFADLAQLRFPSTFDDAFNTVTAVGRAVAGIVNAVVPGLGSILGNIIAALAKILMCIVGSHGLTGAIHADRRGGYGNTPHACQEDYGYGNGYNSFKSSKDVIKHYGLEDSDTQIHDLVNKATHGKGVSSLQGSDRALVELVQKLSGMLHQHQDGENSSSDDLGAFAANVIGLLGVVGNGYSDGYGSDLVDRMIKSVGPAFKKHGVDLSSHAEEIKEKISKYGRNNFGGALRDSDDDDDSDDSDSNSNNSDSEGNSGNDNSEGSSGHNDNSENEGSSGSQHNANENHHSNNKHENNNHHKNGHNSENNDKDSKDCDDE